jgi:hypothetical protein
MTFQLKLVLSMVLLVVGITATTLLITESQVRLSYQRHFLQSFGSQVDSFLRQREARLEPVQERVSDAALNTRLVAAMENADLEHPDQRDIDDVYQNARDQLAELMAAVPGGQTNKTGGFYFFLNGKGEVLYPSAQVQLPFSLLGLRKIARQIETVGRSVIGEN